MTGRTNEEWLHDLRGPKPDEALADLRALLLQGLRYAIADRPQVTGAHIEGFVQEALLKILDGLDTLPRRCPWFRTIWSAAATAARSSRR